MSEKPKKWGKWPTVQPGGLPRSPQQSETRRTERHLRNRPGGPKKPNAGSMPPGKPPAAPAKRRSGCMPLFWLAVILGVVILIVRARQGH